MLELSTAKILIVDDNKSVLDSLKFLLEDYVESVVIIKNPNLILQHLKTEEFDLVLLDMNFKAGTNTGNEGFYWLKEIKKYDSKIGVVLITAYANIDLAVNAMKEGASDFIQKPWDNKRVLATLQSAYLFRKSQLHIENLKQKQRILTNLSESQNDIIWGQSPAMIEVLKTIDKISQTNVNALILGENGVGKEIIAYEIHNTSARKNELFLKVDMGSLSQSLFESELFGHVKGAFTDAKESRIGKFEAASGGTLFLDEIGNLPVSLQTKLLSVLQNKMITPLGSNKMIPVDFRLICATNMNLKSMIEGNLFREDLYYRINTVTIETPSLRDRQEDINELIQFFLNKYANRYNKTKLKLSKKAIDKLVKYSWPGNIRELKHTIEKAVILCDNTNLLSDDFGLDNDIKETSLFSNAKTLDEFERMAIINSLKNNKGNLSHTAKELNIGRQTLYNKIQKYDI